MIDLFYPLFLIWLGVYLWLIHLSIRYVKWVIDIGGIDCTENFELTFVLIGSVFMITLKWSIWPFLVLMGDYDFYEEVTWISDL